MSDNDGPAHHRRPFDASRDDRLRRLERTRLIVAATSEVLSSSSSSSSSSGGADGKPAVLLHLSDGDGASSPTTTTHVLRPPSNAEFQTLTGPTCRCRVERNGDGILLMYPVDTNTIGWQTKDLSDVISDQVHDTTFAGRVVLGVTPSSGVGGSIKGGGGRNDNANLLPSPGVRQNGRIVDCIVECGCVVSNNAVVSDSHVMAGAAIVGCGAVSGGGGGDGGFSDAIELSVGPEAGGGRNVLCSAESTLVDVCRDLGMGGRSSAGADEKKKECDATTTTTIDMTTLCPGSSILHTPTVSGVYLGGPGASIRSATSVSRSVLLPGASIVDGSTVANALLQWNATISTHSSVDGAFLMEKSAIGPASFVSSAIFGPDAHVSGGEVHCTLFGPNCNAHHQSLQIGCLWPLGRGNVGYGANVGSNHTGRLPDQEAAVGEGTFWGLGAVIKFPVDLTSGPYSIVAAGVNLVPQRITMPFSLITEGPPSGGGMNQLTPGWVLRSSPYTVARSEAKFATRRKAKRHDFYTGWRIVRPGVVDMCLAARDALIEAGGDDCDGTNDGRQMAGEKARGPVATQTKKLYRTDRDVPGIGANCMTEKGRRDGIEAYADAIQRYALRGWLDQMVKGGDGGAFAKILKDAMSAEKNKTKRNGSGGGDALWPTLPWEEPSHADPIELWNHQRSVLVAEIPSIIRASSSSSLSGSPPMGDVHPGELLKVLLGRVVDLERDHAERVRKSKSRDDVRGEKTIPGYGPAHTPAAEDPVVIAAREEALSVGKDVENVLVALRQWSSDAAPRERSRL